MKYLSYSLGPQSKPLLGALINNEQCVLNLLAYAEKVDSTLVESLGSMRELIESGSMVWQKVTRLKVQAEQNLEALQSEKIVTPLAEVTLENPLPNPNSLRDFITFEAHIKRGYEIRNKPFPEEWYERPVYYKGNHRTVFGPNDAIEWPCYTQKLDYELEYACIVGQQGQDITVEKATDYIFGFTILNDWSARDIQFKEMMCRLGPAKGKDFATSIGPYIVTPDEIPDIRNLTMRAFVNGEKWSEGNSGTSYWTWEEMIAYVSLGETIYPSDILGSGTVGGGCGYELQRWIQPGDEIILEVDGLGQLKNTIIASKQSSPPSIQKTMIKQNQKQTVS